MEQSTTTGWAILAMSAHATSPYVQALGTRTIQFGAPVDDAGNVLLDDAARRSRRRAFSSTSTG